MNVYFRLLFLLWVASLFIGVPQAECSALDQLITIGGGSLPDVPMPGNPVPDNPSTYERPQTHQRPSYNSSYSAPSYEERQRQKKQREERRKERERARKKARHDAEYRKERERKEPAEWDWPKGLPRKRSYYSYSPKRTNSLIKVPEKIKPGDETKALQEVSLKIKGLRLKTKLSFEEKQALEKLEEKARELWFKTIKSCTRDKNRYRTVVPLGLQNARPYSEPARLSSDNLKNLQNQTAERSALLIDPIAKLYQEKTGQLIELKAEEFAEKLSDKANRFSEVLAVGKVSMQLADKDYHAATGETVNYLIGRIPYPQAQLAAEGGKIYGNVVFRAINDFMRKAMEATGGHFDQKQFWDDLKKEMSFAQKSFLKWAGDPEND
ncbi:MAG: hypothetical protein Kow0029_28480 [Candidatus Rifleibacteriota bacterium]